jgi:hypothetical protein
MDFLVELIAPAGPFVRHFLRQLAQKSNEPTYSRSFPIALPLFLLYAMVRAVSIFSQVLHLELLATRRLDLTTVFATVSSHQYSATIGCPQSVKEQRALYDLPARKPIEFTRGMNGVPVCIRTDV